MDPGLLVLSQRDLRQVMTFGDYVEAVAEGFRLLAEGRCAAPVPAHLDVEHGTFHVKMANLPRGPGYVAVKVNVRVKVDVKPSTSSTASVPSALALLVRRLVS